jgi:nifR3 family TIM-barrel protein
MVRGFWKNLKRPIYCLAPMADVTDAAFRRIIAKYSKLARPDGTSGGGPDVMWTEFVSADGLCSAGRGALLRDLWFTDAERPIVAQFFGATPEHFYQCALLAQELGFDGIDINMGCPDRAVLKQGAGAALIQNPALAQKIISETKRGAGPLPVSVKTRIGYTKNELATWLLQLLEADIAAVIIHARTAKELSLVPAHWEAIAEAVGIAQRYDSSSERTLIIGNGDIETVTEANEKARACGADGIMIGRGIFGNPWVFDRKRNPDTITLDKKLRVMLEHTKLFEDIYGGTKNFDVMKKHYQAYIRGFDGAKELRIKLMAAKSSRDVERIVRSAFPDIQWGSRMNS